MKHLPLFRFGRVAALVIVDDADALMFGDERWGLHDGYAARAQSGGHATGWQPRVIFLHREILGLPRYYDGRETDHRNRNRLDCRRENLRIVTSDQNKQNRSTQAHTSVHRGVFWHEGKQRWIGRAYVNGRNRAREFRSEAAAAAYAASLRADHMPFSEEGGR